MRDAGVAVKRSVMAMLACGLLAAVAAPIAPAAFPGENGRIVFKRHTEDGADRICTVVQGGAVWGCFAPDGSVPSLPAWSPDGEKIAFGTAGGLYTIDADGSNLTLVRNNASQAAWSPAAKAKFVFVNLGLWTSNLDGSGATQITTNAFHLYPDWSPDGKRIVFVSTQDGNYELYVYLVETGQVVRLTNTAEHEQDPDFSPDGSKILFTSRDTSFGNPQLHTMKADGSARTPLGVAGSDGAWSPDGQKIAFVKFEGLLYTVNADGTGETWSSPETDGDYFNHTQPDWRPLPVNTASTYVRPAGATPLQIPLVPAAQECTAPNRTHGPPLAFGACAPPAPGSPNLTVGVGDGSPALSRSVGNVRLAVLPGAPGGVDDTDVRIRFSLSNVMNASDLSEYTGELRASATTRITDREGAVGQTTVGFPLEFDVPCVGTEPTIDKSLCALTTTLDAISPGAAAEGTRAVWALDQLKVYDGGADGDADTTADNSLFAVQGVFVP